MFDIPLDTLWVISETIFPEITWMVLMPGDPNKLLGWY